MFPISSARERSAGRFQTFRHIKTKPYGRENAECSRKQSLLGKNSFFLFRKVYIQISIQGRFYSDIKNQVKDIPPQIGNFWRQFPFAQKKQIKIETFTADLGVIECVLPFANKKQQSNR